MTKSRFNARRLALMGAGLCALAMAFLGVASGATSGPYSATFDGAPAAPMPAAGMLADFDVQVHSRNSNTWYQLEAMTANHGMDCGAPPATHTTNGSYGDAVFQCKNHLMTAINASDTSGYAMIYLTPNRLVDFTAGTTTVKWELSSFRHSIRDFVDFWIVPYEDQIALPFDMGDVDGQGLPRQGIHIRMDQFNGETIYRAYVIDNFVQTEIPSATWSTLESQLAAAGRAPSQAVRETFEIQLSKTHLRFGVPALNWWPVDAPVGPLPYSQGVFQMGQHSYNPTKDNSGVPATWHWDAVSISQAVPFTIIKADQRYIDSPTQTLTFNAPAPANSNVRFTSIGKTQVSFDGGPFQAAVLAAGSEQGNHPEHLSNYWMQVPAGTRTLKLKWAPDGWYQGPYIAKDFAIWSRDGSSAPVATNTPSAPAATSTPAAIAPTSTATVAAPTATATTPPPNATPTSLGVPSSLNRVTWNGKSWYLHGANLPWYNWGCDFGCTSNGGASSATVNAAVGAAFAQAKANGVNVIRWWVFPGDPWQISRASDGTPTGVNPSVYTDLDAALALAAQYDIYLDLVLFSSPSAMPSSWLNDSTQRTRLADVLAPMFARYKNNPRLMTWEIINEPEFDIWSGLAGETQTKAMVKAVAASVHASSPALVTVGSAMVDGLGMWVGQGLDYYQAHWYDYMQPGNWCARCSDYATLRTTYGLDKPLVIGEFYASNTVDSLQRYEDWYSKGFAGAWSWSLLTDRTSDGLTVDLAAAKTFSSRHSDLGPKSTGGTTPTATPTVAATSAPTKTPVAPTSTPTKTPAAATATPTKTPSALTFTTTTTTSKSSLTRGSKQTFSVKTKASASTTILLDVEVFAPDGTRVFQKVYDNQALSGGAFKTFSPTWTVPANGQKGTYTIKVGVFAPGWSSMYSWDDNAGTFTVR